jgi:hypothetical protein
MVLSLDKPNSSDGLFCIELFERQNRGDQKERL